MSIIKDYVIVQPKSKVKAGEGLIEGKYKFFTSSNTQTKWLNEFYYDKPALIFGTGGMASVHYCDTPFSTSTDCIVMYAKDSTNLEYIYHYLESHMEVLEDGFKGAGLKHISKDYILNIQIPEKELLEQKKIVDLCNNIDLIVAASKKQLEKLDELVKSRFVELFGDPVSNSKNLPELTLPELGEFGRGVSKHRPRNDPQLLGGEYPLIQTGEIANSNLYITAYENTYSELGLKQSKLWQKDTLCITIAANIAKTAILTFDACFPDSVVGFKSSAKTNNIFIHYWFSFFQAILEAQAPESAQKNINLKTLSELKAIVPPIELQNEFADFVKEVDKSKFEVQQSLEKLETLKKSLMQQYFG